MPPWLNSSHVPKESNVAVFFLLLVVVVFVVAVVVAVVGCCFRRFLGRHRTQAS